MVKPVKGFITNDGKFFETQDEADLHEAEKELLVSLEAHEVSSDALVWVLALRHEIQDYLTAYEAVHVPVQIPNKTITKKL